MKKLLLFLILSSALVAQADQMCDQITANVKKNASQLPIKVSESDLGSIVNTICPSLKTEFNVNDLNSLVNDLKTLPESDACTKFNNVIQNAKQNLNLGTIKNKIVSTAVDTQFHCNSGTLKQIADFIGQ